MIAVLTAEDMAADGIGPLPSFWSIPNWDGSASFVPAMHALAVDRVRYVGHPCAVVVATSDAAARDGAERVAITFSERPAAATLDEAMAPGAPAVWSGCPSNVNLEWTIGDEATVERAFRGGPTGWHSIWSITVLRRCPWSRAFPWRTTMPGMTT